MIISGTIDDGYGNIRAVFFRESAEKIMGITGADIQKIVKDGGDPISIYDKCEVVGKNIEIAGSVKMNDFTGNIELLVNNVKEIDIQKESNDMIEKIKMINELK